MPRSARSPLAPAAVGGFVAVVAGGPASVRWRRDGARTLPGASTLPDATRAVANRAGARPGRILAPAVAPAAPTSRTPGASAPPTPVPAPTPTPVGSSPAVASGRSVPGPVPGPGASGPGGGPALTGAGMAAPPTTGGGRLPAAGVGTVLVARRRRT